MVIVSDAATGKLVIEDMRKMLIDVCAFICLGSDILLLFLTEVIGLLTHTDQFYF